MTTWNIKYYLNNLIIPIALCAMSVTSGFSSWTVEKSTGKKINKIHQKKEEEVYCRAVGAYISHTLNGCLIQIKRSFIWDFVV